MTPDITLGDAIAALALRPTIKCLEHDLGFPAR